MRRFHRISVTAVAILFWSSVIADGAPVAKVEFTQVPKAGKGSDSQGNIAGVVKGIAKPEQYKVVLYARTDWWYVQPQTIDPLTTPAMFSRRVMGR